MVREKGFGRFVSKTDLSSDGGDIMARQTQLKIVNIFLTVAFILQVVTGIANEALDEHTFLHLHGFGGLLMVVFGVWHVVLNRGWFRTVVGGKR